MNITIAKFKKSLSSLDAFTVTGRYKLLTDMLEKEGLHGEIHFTLINGEILREIEGETSLLKTFKCRMTLTIQKEKSITVLTSDEESIKAYAVIDALYLIRQKLNQFIQNKKRREEKKEEMTTTETVIVPQDNAVNSAEKEMMTEEEELEALLNSQDTGMKKQMKKSAKEKKELEKREADEAREKRTCEEHN